MSFSDRVIDSYKFLDKNGLKKAFELIKNHDVHWTGTHAEYEAQKDTIPDYAILHFTDDYDEGGSGGAFKDSLVSTNQPYLYKGECHQIPDWDKINTFVEDKSLNGSCSGFVRDGKFYRSFDFLYNDTVSFAVDNRVSSYKGMAGAIPELTKSVVDSRVDVDWYEYIPFVLLDGINSYGISVSAYILHREGERTDQGDTKQRICSSVLTSYLLCNLTDVDDLNTVLGDICVYMPSKPAQFATEYHWLISDGTKTVCLEYVDNLPVITDITANPYITNFYLKDWNGSDLSTTNAHAQGIERWNLIKEGAELEDIAYTHTYSLVGTENVWRSEYNDVWGVGDDITTATPDDDPSLLAHETAAKTAWENRTRGNGTWHTQHACVYDFSTKSFKVCSQEDYETWYSETEGYTKSEIDNLLSQKMDKSNPSGTGSFSLNRKSDSTIGNYSFAEGHNTSATGESSHAEGQDTKAEGVCSHAEGYATLVVNNGVDEHSGDYAHAEGMRTTAVGAGSHSEGLYTHTNNPGEHAEGRGNISNKNSDTFGDSRNTIHSVGIGGTEVGTFKNAHEIMQNGDHYVFGIGGYDGTNPSTAKTLQEVVNGGTSTCDVIPMREETCLDIYNAVVADPDTYKQGSIIEVLSELPISGFGTSHFLNRYGLESFPSSSMFLITTDVDEEEVALVYIPRPYIPPKDFRIVDFPNVEETASVTSFCDEVYNVLFENAVPFVIQSIVHSSGAWLDYHFLYYAGCILEGTQVRGYKFSFLDVENSKIYLHKFYKNGTYQSQEISIGGSGGDVEVLSYPQDSEERIAFCEQMASLLAAGKFVLLRESYEDDPYVCNWYYTEPLYNRGDDEDELIGYQFVTKTYEGLKIQKIYFNGDEDYEIIPLFNWDFFADGYFDAIYDEESGETLSKKPVIGGGLIWTESEHIIADTDLEFQSDESRWIGDLDDYKFIQHSLWFFNAALTLDYTIDGEEFTNETRDCDVSYDDDDDSFCSVDFNLDAGVNATLTLYNYKYSDPSLRGKMVLTPMDGSSLDGLENIHIKINTTCNPELIKPEFIPIDDETIKLSPDGKLKASASPDVVFFDLPAEDDWEDETVTRPFYNQLKSAIDNGKFIIVTEKLSSDFDSWVYYNVAYNSVDSSEVDQEWINLTSFDGIYVDTLEIFPLSIKKNEVELKGETIVEFDKTNIHSVYMKLFGMFTTPVLHEKVGQADFYWKFINSEQDTGIGSIESYDFLCNKNGELHKLVIFNYSYQETIISNQASTMPIADTYNLGQIIQYTGITNDNYTNGFFYKCIESIESSGVYSWEAVNVQSGGGGVVLPVNPAITPTTEGAMWIEIN